jgi:hypothetical protein
MYNTIHLLSNLDRITFAALPLELCGKALEGTPHRGGDDAWNIALLLFMGYNKERELVLTL